MDLALGSLGSESGDRSEISRLTTQRHSCNPYLCFLLQKPVVWETTLDVFPQEKTFRRTVVALSRTTKGLLHLWENDALVPWASIRQAGRQAGDFPVPWTEMEK